MPSDYGPAAEALAQRLRELQWNPADLAREAGVDQGTVLDFLNGQRTPQPKTQGKLEQAVGWPAGALRTLARGGTMPASTQQAEGVVRPPLRAVETQENPVIAAIKADPNLLPESKAHFLNQYELLLRVQPVADEPLRYVAHGPRVSDTDEDARIEAEVREAVKRNRDGGDTDSDKG